MLLFLFKILFCCRIAGDWYVDLATGDDASSRTDKPVKTISRAIQLAQPGDTIHLRPITYRDWAPFFDKSGAPGKPIILDGHGAVLDGCDPIDPSHWTEIEPGLYRNDDLMPLTDAIIDRWFFVFDGQIQRMARCSKGPSQPLKCPNDLLEKEWTFVKDAERTKAARPGYIFGAFWVRLPQGQSIASANLEYPMRMAGVAMRGDCSHLVVRNLTATRPYNDGFNLADCKDVLFENIRAIDCGDDGISAHGQCKYKVKQFRSIRNATGICDTDESKTTYDGVWIEDCIGSDLYFLGTGTYNILNARVRSKSARPLYLQGDESKTGKCKVSLHNVWFERLTADGEVRVSPNCELHAMQSTFTNLDWQATGGLISLEKCLIGGDATSSSPRKPRVHLWPAARWLGRRNHYDWESIRVSDRFFSTGELKAFPSTVELDEFSTFGTLEDNKKAERDFGVRLELLPQ